MTNRIMDGRMMGSSESVTWGPEMPHAKFAQYSFLRSWIVRCRAQGTQSGNGKMFIDRICGMNRILGKRKGVEEG